MMRHAVLGAGGIGGLLAAAFARAGRDVVLLMRPSSFERYDGRLVVESEFLGHFEVPVSAASHLPEPPDVLWVATKAYDLEGALGLAPAETVGPATVVPLLNGIEHVALLRTRYADVLAAAIAVESERLEVGHIRQKFPFVSVSLAPHPAAEAIGRELVDAGIDCAEATDEATVLWRKMAFLAPVALTTSALGAPLGAVRADPPWGERLDSCREEVIAAARAEGAGIDAAVLRALHHHRAPDDLQSSMQKDLAAGRPVELDAIGGSVVRTAQRHGQLVPVTEELIDLVSARVAG